MTSNPPIDAMVALVEYLECDEAKCFAEMEDNGDDTSDHIWHSVKAVRDWLSVNGVDWEARCAKRLEAFEAYLKGVKGGMIFEFAEIDAAKGFVARVREQFGLDGRVFDNEEEAALSHPFPWQQIPPVAHIDRTYDDTEREVRALASTFKGEFVGT
jgi:hypothetical protein